MEFCQLMIDILVYVSCKFQMYIFKIAQVISENVRIAFLYVLSIESNPPPGDAEQHTNGTTGEYWLHLQQDYPAQTHAETWVHLQVKPD